MYRRFIEAGYRHPFANNLVDIIKHAVEVDNGNGITFYDFDENKQFLSYKQLYELAKIYAGALKERGISGTMLICSEDPFEFNITKWACILSKIVVVPVESLRVSEIQDGDYSRILKICKQLGNVTIAVDSDSLEIYRKGISGECPGINIINISDLKNGTPIEPVECNPDDVVCICYSSGSTGNPKGIVITHKNLVTAMGPIVCALKLTEDVVWAIWSPHFHILGMNIEIIVMNVLGSAIMFSPAFFIQHPTRYMQIIGEARANVIMSNNFGLEWLIKNVNVDDLAPDSLKQLDSSVVASEVISINTVNRYVEKFKPLGLEYKDIRPVYGLTEASLATTMTEINEEMPVIPNINNDGTMVVSVGRPLPGFTVTIVDANGRTVGDDKYGEICIESDAVTKGYITENGTIDSSAFSSGVLKTGDIGFFHDGYLYISGRKKEMFIVRGHNYMIHDIECEIMGITGWEAGKIAVSAMFDSSRDEEVLLLFIAMEKTNKLMKMIDVVSHRLISKYGFSFQNIVFMETFLYTGSGKLDRNGLIRSFKEKNYIESITASEKSFTSGASVSDQNNNELSIKKLWSEVLGISVSSIDNDVPFIDYGGNSVKQYLLLEKMNEYFGLNLRSSFIRDYGTVRKMAEGISERNSNTTETEENIAVSSEDIAITGMSFRLPGADTKDELWELLINGKSGVKKVSEKRKSLVGVDEWDSWLGEYDDIDMFDPEFFGMTEKEAAFTDPQQRLLFETAYEALEDAAEAFVTEEPRNIGVFTGLLHQLYLVRVLEYVREHGVTDVPATALVGNINSTASSRISHYFNFRGPSIAVDTACSSFLVSLHNARKAIQRREISGAVVSAAHFMMDKEAFMVCDNAGILSKSDKSKVFDKDADGSVLGEGVVSIYVEPLSSAINKKKHIYAVIKGSACNNDGYSMGIMAPNADGQFDVLKKAYQDAGVSPNDISYLEAHGTGTRIGDPIEFRSLVKLFTEVGSENIGNETIGIGSIKSNMGHLLSAASGAGIVKLLECFERKTLVPSINMNNINPALNIRKTPFYVVTEAEEWKVADGKKRCAAITSLGIGRTNSHFILQEYDERPSAPQYDLYPIIISAKTGDALEKKVKQLLEFIPENISSLGDICYTLCKGRSVFEYRAACVLDRNNISESLKNIRYAEYNRIKSAPVYFDLGNVNTEDAAYAAKKQLILSVARLIGNFGGIIINGQKYTLNEFEDGNIRNSDGESETFPKKSLIVSVDSEETQNAMCVKSDDLAERFKVMSLFTDIFLRGGEIIWEDMPELSECGITSLPNYPFNNRSIWLYI